MVTVTWQTLITAAAVLAAVAAILGKYNKAYDMVKHQEEQDKSIKEIREQLDKTRNEMQKQHDESIARVQEEQAVLTYGILACLKGLQEQGCDGPVTDAIKKLETHLNKASHGLA